MKKELEKKLEELNLEYVPTFQEWLENWLGSVRNLDGTMSFFSLLKSHKYWLCTQREWDRKDEIDKKLVYKDWYKNQFLPTHLGIKSL
jgi:hypothetical protein